MLLLTEMNLKEGWDPRSSSMKATGMIAGMEYDAY